MKTAEFERPIVTVDIVLVTMVDGQLQVGLMERDKAPNASELALVGGYVHTNEDRDADASVRRILETKAGIVDVYFEQLRTFTGAARDPRGWSVSIAYFALVEHALLRAKARDDLVLKPIDNVDDLPFDHAAIIASARARLRGKGAYSSMVARLLPESFTMSELQSAYETVLGERLDQSAFRRKINDLGFLEEIEGQKRQTRLARRPTALYRLRDEPTVFDRRI